MLFKKSLDFLKSFGDIAYTMKENMKIQFWFLGVATLLLMTGLLYAGAVLSDFRAEPGLNKVELKWVCYGQGCIRRRTDLSVYRRFSVQIIRTILLLQDSVR